MLSPNSLLPHLPWSATNERLIAHDWSRVHPAHDDPPVAEGQVHAPLNKDRTPPYKIAGVTLALVSALVLALINNECTIFNRCCILTSAH